LIIILDRVVKLSDLTTNTKPHIARLRKTRQPEFLAANGKAELVVISTKAFLKIKQDFETVEIVNQVNEMMLEEFRVGKITAEQLRGQIQPNPRAIKFISAKEAFAYLRRRAAARKKKLRVPKKMKLNHDDTTTRQGEVVGS
jgi:hypothetical protein